MSFLLMTGTWLYGLLSNESPTATNEFDTPEPYAIGAALALYVPEEPLSEWALSQGELLALFKVSLPTVQAAMPLAVLSLLQQVMSAVLQENHHGPRIKLMRDKANWSLRGTCGEGAATLGCVSIAYFPDWLQPQIIVTPNINKSDLQTLSLLFSHESVHHKMTFRNHALVDVDCRRAENSRDVDVAQWAAPYYPHHWMNHGAMSL
ncbi:MAG: hypothetical protein COB66_02240 [Coxiella sp. (in: Bacteria)]|nr:MAG: hypothetical protein COB66_02240 [Coxiella sp. (in: g-proteobacteria)]